MLRPGYPHELEAYWLEVAKTVTRGNTVRDVLHRLRPDIVRLADRFTTDRPAVLAAPYLRDTRICAAYSLYFAPQTHARMAHILAELSFFPDLGRPLRVLDLGCGTGAAAWALLDHLGRRPVALFARDQSRAALRCLHDLFAAQRPTRWPEALLRTDAAPLEEFVPDAGKFDIILLHYVLNELAPEARRLLLTNAARSLAPEGRLIICEPVLRAAGDYMRHLRTQALADLGLHILAPCPHAHACPLGETCHDVRTWILPRSLQILNATLRRDLRHLAYSLLVLSPPPRPGAIPAAPAPFRARLVGSPAHAKGHTLCPACCSDGQIHRLQLLHRDFDTAGRKNLRQLERGYFLRLATLKPLGDPPLHRAVPATET